MSLFIGISGEFLNEEDILNLKNPLTSAVILFRRNFINFSKLRELTQEIKKIRADILICTDHEGGRVQRFKSEEFFNLPALNFYGKVFKQNQNLALLGAKNAGIITAYELAQVGLDFSFAPVLDLEDENSEVINNRAFHQKAEVVSLLSKEFRLGLKTFGMAAVGKHFPGHGRIKADSHKVLPIDNRAYWERLADRKPFFENIDDGIEAIMAAHILLPEDKKPAGFSKICLEQLRNWGFEGAIISDDLDMQGAGFFKTPLERVKACFEAGADAAMICNNFSAISEVLNSNLEIPQRKKSLERLEKLRRKNLNLDEKTYIRAKEELEKLLRNFGEFYGS